MHKAPNFAGLGEVIGRQPYTFFFLARLISRLENLLLWVEGTCHRTKFKNLAELGLF